MTKKRGASSTGARFSSGQQEGQTSGVWDERADLAGLSRGVRGCDKKCEPEWKGGSGEGSEELRDERDVEVRGDQGM